jgi:hypothetical protein
MNMQKYGIALSIALIMAIGFTTCSSPLENGASASVTAVSYTVSDTAAFNQAIAEINADPFGGDYTITLTGGFASASIDFSPNAAKTITIKGDTLMRTISNNGSKALFTLRSGITLVLDNNSMLNGNSKSYSVVSVLSGGELIMKQGSEVIGAFASGIDIFGGTFTMSGGTISGNTASSSGGGVFVASNGVFAMSGGTISGNTSSYYGYHDSYYNYYSGGGGVYVAANGIFTMSGGTISGNTASSYGGGVFVASNGVFTMSDGTISGNIADSSYGGGVYSRGTFIKQGGGTIDDTNSASRGKVAYVYNGEKKRNTTAGPTDDLNSDISGSMGGWE